MIKNTFSNLAHLKPVRQSILVLIYGILVLLCALLFQIKYKVAQLEKDKKQITRDIKKAETSLHLLRGEWAVLSHPIRVEKLADKHLKTIPQSAKQTFQATSTHTKLKNNN